MLKKIWNHNITVGDYIKMSIACIAVYAVWLVNWMYKLRKLNDTIAKANKEKFVIFAKEND